MRGFRSNKRGTFRFPIKKRRGPMSFRTILLVSAFIFIFLTIQALIIVEKGIRPTLVTIASTETQKIGTLAINQAVSKKTLEDSFNREMIEYISTENGKFLGVEFNAAVAHRFLHDVTHSVQVYLNDLERGRIRELSIPEDVDLDRDGISISERGIIYMMPLGQITNNALLAHLGPKVPVRFSVIGNVKSNFSHKAEELGINNTLLTISVDIEVDVKVIIPFATETNVVRTSFPLAWVYLHGDVPEFYSTGGERGSVPAVIDRTKSSGE
ncbi:sporulation protein YunB [Anaerobacillus sp. CMMVII]|uniref:sporulation protein YunB n=1 Tax=Anaerobacillus sp. CMMVII TaxID=2755588 RepID=UPI0021B73360|nr:sporulation protein YunB [Anaerobacillus sp. CMMVII]MCT8136664.1 sporulation protein YunB [Anaerobacillus sp. CMMVII]